PPLTGSEAPPRGARDMPCSEGYSAAPAVSLSTIGSRVPPAWQQPRGRGTGAAHPRCARLAGRRRSAAMTAESSSAQALPRSLLPLREPVSLTDPACPRPATMPAADTDRALHSQPPGVGQPADRKSVV